MLRARALISSGVIAALSQLVSYLAPWLLGRRWKLPMSFGEGPANGVTLLTIQGVHTLDFATAVLGPFADLTALTTT